MPRRRKKPPRPGAPAWMATFADLSTLLLVFFVLLLSFSEMDVQRYKQLVGSMREAFGVQREVVASQVPMGTSFVAQQFSPGRPQPTPLDLVRQLAPQKDQSPPQHARSPIDGPRTATAGDAERVRRTLRQAIGRGLVEVEHDQQVITIRIRETGSFASGRAELIEPFDPVIEQIAAAVAHTEGMVVLAGHTDDVPIDTPRFRSNWELSAARAVTVAHRLLAESPALRPERLSVHGYADTRPLVPNTSPAHRARNRRVEIQIVRGEAALSSTSAAALAQ